MDQNVEERRVEELGVSNTLIRESLCQLEQKGLIKGKRMVKPTETDLRNLFQICILLEGFAILDCQKDSYRNKSHAYERVPPTF